ncbi:MAG: SDR family oxidoreductase [Myxococcales bacterium]|nr:SDR family oxidoreductase [Myxococcales bacterium]MCB9643486.1 SDR family oxidoreductase [Myxococcales bacterium]
MSKEKVVWITGASSGIGEALAYAYAATGARLILSARRGEVLEDVKKRCSRADEDIAILALDLEKSAEMPEKVKQALQFFGYVDILINNGGISQRALIQDTDLSVDRRIMEINYFGTVALTKALLPSMIARRTGQIAMVTSLTGKFGTPLRSSYAASKHALHGFCDALRAEMWKDGISVTVICPGYIKTSVSINALTGDGSSQGTMDQAQANGMSAEVCAQKIVHALQKKKEEVYIGGREVMGVYLKRFFPTLFSRILRKAKVT